MLEFIAIALGGILILGGFIGNILPLLPGPPLSFLGLLILALVQGFLPPLTPPLLVVMAVLTVMAVVADQFLPVLGAKKYGASKWGAIGALAGMVLGVFFSPLGVLLGALTGAFAGEWLVHRKSKLAWRATWGVLLGSILGIALKMAISGIMAFFFIQALF